MRVWAYTAALILRSVKHEALKLGTLDRTGISGIIELYRNFQ